MIKLKKKERAIAMFKMHMQGKSYDEIGKEHGVSKTVVWRVAKKYDWEKLQTAYWQRTYEKVVNSGAKQVASKIMGLIKHHVNGLQKKVADDPNYTLSIDDVRELRQLLDALLKENRLNDGKPTEAIGGTVRHVVELPPGVKHYGVDPPGPNVIEIEGKTADEKANDDTIDPEDLD